MKEKTSRIKVFISITIYILLVYLMFLIKEKTYVIIPFFIISIALVEYQYIEIRFLLITLLFFLSLLIPKFHDSSMHNLLYSFISFISVLLFSIINGISEKKKIKTQEEIAKKIEELNKKNQDINSSILFYKNYIDNLSLKMDIKSKLINILKEIGNAENPDNIIKKLISSIKILFPDSKTEFILIPKSGIVSDVFLTKVPVFIPSVTKEVRYRISYFSEDEKSIIFLPLVCFSKVYGVLKVYSQKEDYFDMDDFRILEIIATTAAISIENISLFKTTQELALKDPLTGIYTRRAFEDKMDEEILVSARTKKPFSLAIIDIDHFKKINDTYGHQVGDEILKYMANMIKSSMREFDFIARYGGEEFALIMPQTDKKTALQVLRELTNLIKNYPPVVDENIIKITVSIGVSEFPLEALSKSQIIRVADERLYKAKNEGRDKIIYE
jgi:diguanylate cyclase (GGDEF)-like protein